MALGDRNFKYPSKNFVIIKFKNAGTFKLPYYVNILAKSTPRIDANIYFKTIGIPSDLSTTGLVFDKNTKPWSDEFATYTGYNTRNLYMNLIDIKEYKDESASKDDQKVFSTSIPNLLF